MTAPTIPSEIKAYISSYDDKVDEEPGGPTMSSMSCWSRFWIQGWQARTVRRKVRVFAIASWPANMKINMFPETSSGDRSASGRAFDGKPACTRRSALKRQLAREFAGLLNVNCSIHTQDVPFLCKVSSLNINFLSILDVLHITIQFSIGQLSLRECFDRRYVCACLA